MSKKSWYTVYHPRLAEPIRVEDVLVHPNTVERVQLSKEYADSLRDSGWDVVLLNQSEVFVSPAVITGDYSISLKDNCAMLRVSDADLSLFDNDYLPFPVRGIITIATLDVGATISCAAVEDGDTVFFAAPEAYAVGNVDAQTEFTIPARSLATLVKIDTNVWYVSGSVEAEPE